MVIIYNVCDTNSNNTHKLNERYETLLMNKVIFVSIRANTMIYS